MKRARTGRGWLRLFVLALAVAYPVALVLVLVALRGIGERWPTMTLALYLPRLAFGLPLPLLTLALLFVKPRRWLLTQVAAAALLLFPIMGLAVLGPRVPTAGAIRLRVMSFNVDLAPDADVLAAAIRAVAPDVVCLQEARDDEVATLARLLPGYVVRADGQFVVVSKHPIIDVYLPPPLREDRARREANFVRYRIEAPGGPLDVYSMHPVSPHGAFDALRAGGLLHALASGRFFTNEEGFRRLAHNAVLRGLQARAVAEHAATSRYPVLIMGDTNLPSGSPILARDFGAYQDGFEAAGRGFGYSFPARRVPAWLRLDRIMADARLRFVTFSRLDVRISTHFPVVADLERTPAVEEPPRSPGRGPVLSDKK